MGIDYKLVYTNNEKQFEHSVKVMGNRHPFRPCIVYEPHSKSAGIIFLQSMDSMRKIYGKH